MRLWTSLFGFVALAVVATSCTNDIGVTCPPGKLTCNNECVAIAEDVNNCGGCGIQCPGEIVCIGGQCTCPKDQQNCGDVCVRQDRDPLHCGSCDKKCAADQVCALGKCASSCPAPTTECAGGCVDTQTDSANCGACDKACPMGQSCKAGKCELLCENNLKVCGTSCVDTQNDPKNCGDCNVPCDPGEFCAAGKCVAGCPAPFILCPNPQDPTGPQLCVDPAHDPKNCGGCGTADVQPGDADMGTGPVLPHVCLGTPGLNTSGVCNNGKCAYVCDDGFGFCLSSRPQFFDGPPPAPQKGEPICLTNFTSDPCNCGGCGIVVAGWFTGEGCGTYLGSGFDGKELCCDSTPQPAANYLSDTSCGSCGGTTDCTGLGSANTCCPIGAIFGNAGPDVAGACTDTGADTNNCGGCGNNCNFQGLNIPLCCDNDGVRCTEGLSDTHCGACGNDCTVAAGGQCCQPLGPGTPPTCIDTNNDPMNCGACGAIAPELCCNGVPSSASSPGSCGGCLNICGGLIPGCCAPTGCVDLATDAANCGSCGNDCDTFCAGQGGTSQGCGLGSATLGQCSCLLP